jgi:hypothetical protein
VIAWNRNLLTHSEPPVCKNQWTAACVTITNNIMLTKNVSERSHYTVGRRSTFPPKNIVLQRWAVSTRTDGPYSNLGPPRERVDPPHCAVRPKLQKFTNRKRQIFKKNEDWEIEIKRENELLTRSKSRHPSARDVSLLTRGIPRDQMRQNTMKWSRDHVLTCSYMRPRL